MIKNTFKIGKWFGGGKKKEESKKKTPTFEIIKEVSKRPILTRSIVALKIEEDKKNKQ